MIFSIAYRGKTGRSASPNCCEAGSCRSVGIQDATADTLQLAYTLPAMPEASPLHLQDLQAVDAGAFFRPRDAEEAGVSYHELRKLVDQGEVEQVARSLYRL